MKNIEIKNKDIVNTNLEVDRIIEEIIKQDGNLNKKDIISSLKEVIKGDFIPEFSKQLIKNK